MIPEILMEINWETINANWMDFFLQGYMRIVGSTWFYPIVFFGFIGYVYALSNSATAAAVLISLIFGVFGITGIFSASPEFVQLSWVIVIISFSATFTALFAGRKR